jgi:long-chain acyl-CoA synthetase
MTASSPVVYAQPPRSPAGLLGQTIPDLLDQGCRYSADGRALNQWQQGTWHSLTPRAFRQMAEEVALGLRHWGLNPQERVALLMGSDLGFAIADMGCLLAGLVDVPIDLTQTIENILFILEQVETSTLMLSSVELLQRVGPYLATATTLKTLIVVTVPEDWPKVRDGFCATVPAADHISLLSLTEVQHWGQAQWSPQQAEQLRQAIAPSDLATILYIASETQRPKGVMLTHENITANVLAAFSSYPGLQNWGNGNSPAVPTPNPYLCAGVFIRSSGLGPPHLFL